MRNNDEHLYEKYQNKKVVTNKIAKIKVNIN